MWRFVGCVLACAVCAPLRAEAEMVIWSGGQARCVIVVQTGAHPAESLAARELARWLGQASGASFEVRELSKAPAGSIVVGPGPAASEAFAGTDLSRLGDEEYVQVVDGGRMLLAGGRPRGTLYAVYRFLADRCGIRWWSPWATNVPRRASLSVKKGMATGKPAFEARDPFWFPAFDEMWAARNGSNSQHARLSEQTGGKIVYKGFVHTFFPLVPPQEHFAAHPEWYSLIGGKRTADGAQLCTTNPELRDHMTERVRAWLLETPDARIVSISQNDWHGACQCASCKAIDTAEGSQSGTMVALLNYVADKLGREFPHVAFDTLAYQYTRKAPKSIRPLSNVIIRLCSIECNFAAPLTDPSNASFARDIVDWNRVSDRLYIWDYTTNFAHYVMPHPNWYSLGPNVRFFRDHGVRGLFEQGAYQSHGSEMAEMRAWVLAQLLWDPDRDDRKLIREFVDGYYGKAAPYVARYLDLMASAAKGSYMGCFASPAAQHLKFGVLSRAERLWESAERAVVSDLDLVWRVRQARLSVWYAWLTNWTSLRRECLKAKAGWPVASSRKTLADTWLRTATGTGPEGWSPMTHVNEGGLTPAAFASRFAEDPPEPTVLEAPVRSKNSVPPTGVAGASGTAWVDLQDSRARLWNEPDGAEARADSAASDGVAVWMPSTHFEWAFQVPLEKLPPATAKGKWRLYAVVRVEAAAPPDPGQEVFSTGIYDTETQAAVTQISLRGSDIRSGYQAFLVGTVTPGKGMYAWVAPQRNPAIRAVWVDRMYLVPAD